MPNKCILIPFVLDLGYRSIWFIFTEKSILLDGSIRMFLLKLWKLDVNRFMDIMDLLTPGF